nr:TolC family outer membrane protein [Acidovorax sp. KKS102]
MQEAISRNPEVLSRFHALQASNAEQDVARAPLRPRVDAQAFGGYSSSRSAGDTNTYSRPGANLQLRQLIFDGNAAGSDLRRAGFARLSRYYDLRASSNQVALETVQAYLDVQRYRELEMLARDNWGFHNETMQQIERRAQAGVGRRVDLELALGRTALSQSNWLTDTSNLHDVTQRFERLVGKAPLQRLEPIPDMASLLPDAQQILPEALRRNPSFLSAVAGIRAARADLNARRAAKSPSVELVAQTGVDRSLSSTNTPERTRNSSVQVLLNYNLYRGGADEARVRLAQESIYTAQDVRDNACRNIRQTAVIAYNDLRRLRDQLSLLEQHQLSSEKAREAYRQQFDIGQRSLLDLLDTENELFQARRAVVNGRHDLLLAGYRVLQQTDGLLSALGQTPLVQAPPPSAMDDATAEDEIALCSKEMTAPLVLDTAAVMAARPPLPPTPELTASQPRPAPASPAAATQASKLDTAQPAATADAAAIEELVRDWSAAWSAKDLNRYLSFYTDRFQPKQGNIDDWKRQRARNLNKVGPIKVAVQNLKVVIENGVAEATFVQHYQSSDFNEVGRKTLRFVRDQQAWKIQQESMLSTRP